jgi:hypothetical protein
MISIWEDLRSLTTVTFEEGAQTLMPRFLQSLQIRRMLVITVKGMDSMKYETRSCDVIWTVDLRIYRDPP